MLPSRALVMLRYLVHIALFRPPLHQRRIQGFARLSFSHKSMAASNRLNLIVADH
jgi:hypothetical protein